ncbi:neuraminidase-like domain-containing protein [Bradyrhizobium sp. 27S5]|uniref:Tc toxin subunit A-related protein n=1 Tax=Bradyrhizobium sp. 27S5 TaxID=3139728 RepID=UPI0030D2EE5C
MLTQDPAEVGFLLSRAPDGRNLDSALKIQSRGQGAFAAAYADAIGAQVGGDPTALKKRADQLYSRAIARADAVAHAFAEAQSLATAQHVDALCSPDDRNRLREQMKTPDAGGATKLPSWEMLFGSLDACACDECDSIYGPASYLVDVLEYFKKLEAGNPGDGTPAPCLAAPASAKHVFDVLMSRRPDIGYLDLNCANAMTPVPYIDLVNELLEDFVGRKPLWLPMKLEPGPIPDIVLNALRANGFLEVTGKAKVTADSLDNRLVRDERALILFKRDGEEAGCPRWLVRQLRQTYGTEKEIAAAPEYVNQEAVKMLKGSHLALALPFDADRVEATAYLGKMGTDRATIIRALSKEPDGTTADRLTAATEALGLTSIERQLITTPDPNHQSEYWAEASETILKRMAQLRRFLDNTGLTTEPVGKSQLDELLAGGFINPCGKTLHIVPDDPTDTSSRCDTEKMRIDGLDKPALDRINRFLRLWRKVRWPMNLLDRLIMSPAVGKGVLDNDCLARIAEIIRLGTDIGIDPTKVAQWFVDISILGEPSDYRRIFLQKGDDGHPYQAFLTDQFCPPPQCQTADTPPCPDLANHKPAIARAIGIPLEQLEALLAYCGNEPGANVAAKLSLANLSRVWAWFQFARKFGLNMRDLISLLSLLGIKDALAEPVVTRKLCEVIALLKKWHIGVADLQFWLLHTTQNSGEAKKRVIADTGVARLLSDLRLKLRAVSDARPAKEITLPVEDSQHSVLGDGMTACVEKLSSVLSQIEGLSAEAARQIVALVQERKTQEDVDSLKALLKAKPLADIAGVSASADLAPVNANGAWTETDEQPAGHVAHRKWAHDLVTILLDHVDIEMRTGITIQVVSQSFKTPVEQAKAILRWCRMPDGGKPAKGGELLAILSAPAWALDPVPTGATPELRKAIEALWDGALCVTDDCIANLDDKQRKFRDAVLKGNPIESWNEPPALADVKQWRDRLSQLFVAVRLAHKISGFTNTLKLQTEEQLLWGLLRTSAAPDANRFQLLGWFSPDEMPLTANGTDAAADYKRLALLLQGLELMETYPLKETPTDPNVKIGASTAFELALLTPKDASGSPLTGLDSIRDIVSICYQLFGSPDVNLLDTAERLDLHLDRTRFKVASTYRRLARAADTIGNLGISFADLDKLVAEDVSRELALVLRQCLKQKSDESSWLDTLKDIQGPIRELKRDALVSYLIADPSHGCFKEANDLYDHFLIDTQMCSCMPTSRIVQAHAVVQLFAQRCLMGQEPSVDPRADDNHGNDWQEWPWMRNYRVWQANRKIFLYPENWIQPDLRDDKSQFFKEFEQSLSQIEVNDLNVEIPARTYLDKLDDAAFMEVLAIHYQDTEYSENGKKEGRVLHVVARTKGGDPSLYYYRRFVEEKYWTAWEKIDLDIATDHVLLFVRNNRLNIAWPIFADVTDESAKIEVPNPTAGKKEAIPTAPRGWSIQLAMSERSNGLWQPKRTSKEAIRSPKLVNAASDQMALERKRCRFVIRDQEPRGVSFPAEDHPEFGFFIIASSMVGSAKDDKGNENYVPLPPEAEPTLMGAFNLAGCRGYPELVSPETLKKIGTSAATALPRFKDSALETQRWIEKDNDADDDLVVEGLVANNFAPTGVLGATPGIFKITTTQQTTLVDDVLSNLLKMLGQVPVRWQPSGIFVPFFYEDGRRGYVAIPTMCPGDREPATISKIVANLQELGVREAAKPGKTWHDLVDQWSKDTDQQAAFDSLTKQLIGCFGLNFHAFYHPFICFLKRSLAAGGFERLMNASPLEWDGDHQFEGLFKPHPAVLTPYPKETSGFSFDRIDGYASYNWEIFYHLPSLVSQKLVLSQKFEDAQRWSHFIFNPSGLPAPKLGDDSGAKLKALPKGPGRYWMTKPFRDRDSQPNPLETYVGQRIEYILASLNDPNNQDVGRFWQDEVTQWRRNPFVPHQIARGRTVAFQKATVMAYLDTIIQWGDYLFRQDTRESVNAALQLYTTAERLLGPRPRVVKAPGTFHSRTYRELEVAIHGAEIDGFDSFGNSLVELESLLPPQPDASETVIPSMPPLPAGALLKVPYFCIPRNEKLMGYWDTVADRLYKIRHCQNIEGVERQLALFAPPIDPGLLVRAVAAGLSIGDVLSQGAGELPQYRFATLAQKAGELTQMVISLGNALLQAIEKKEAEALARLRSNQEIDLLKLVRQIKLNQVQEALQNQAGLERTKAVTEARRDFYRDIKYTIGTEEKSLELNEEGARLGTAGLVFSTAANIAFLIPTFKFGGWGFGGAPGADAEWGGDNIGKAASAMGQFLGGLGGLQREAAGTLLTRAGYERRWDEWKLQERLADRELAQIDRQISAAEIRVEIAKEELSNHDKQREQAEELLAYLKDRKFTNVDLYDWMIAQISATYFQSWQMAQRFALQVERAFHFELGPKDTQFESYVRPRGWDSLHKGLLAGDALLFDLKRMEVDYLARNRRELEITKHISLVRLNPDALITLKAAGRCEIELDELLFDVDYPGHYFRRIKSVALSIPCVAGPYASVNCTLTLTKSQIRIKQARLDDEGDEENLLRNFSRIQSIATSTGQNDSGMFEVNFRDERYLPFEGAGAASTWTLELIPDDNRELDFDTLTDVIMHVKYTARQGSKQFGDTRRKTISRPVVHRLFVLPDEFAGEWNRFKNQKQDADGRRTLTLENFKDRLPYFSSGLSGNAARVRIVSLEHGAVNPGFFFKQSSKPDQSATEWEEPIALGQWEFSCAADTIPKLGLLVSVAEKPAKS